MAAETIGETAAPSTPSVVPKWVEASLFEDLLKSQYADFVKIKDFKALHAMAPGENYAAVMLRIEIQMILEGGKSKTLNYMMKVPHDNDFSRLMLETNNIFTVELGVYNDIIPEFEALYRDAGLEVKFGAESYSFKEVKHDYVLLEDLRPRGFKNANRLEGLDMDHTKSVLKKLAQWHAASAVRVETKGKYGDSYTLGFFTEAGRVMMEQVTGSVSGALMQCMETFKGKEVYIEDAQKLQANMVDVLMKCSKIDSNDFNVLNHGDCWCNNIMFQYDAFGKIKETYFVDFQVPKYGTPAQDLLYFLISSTKFEIKLKEFDYFIKYYHDQLVEHLKFLKYPKKLPPLRLIHSMLYKYGVWGYSTATGVMGGVLLDPTDKASMQNFISDTDAANQFKLLLFSNNRYRKQIEVILPWLHNRGAMEL